mgnify:CR=1 FL=1
MYNLKFIISVSIFIFFLIITSIVKNQSRILEKKIIGLKSSVLFKENNLSETQLEFSYLTSPREIEKKMDKKDLKKFQPIKHSKIFNDTNDFINVENKLSNLSNIDEKKTSKK